MLGRVVLPRKRAAGPDSAGGGCAAWLNYVHRHRTSCWEASSSAVRAFAAAAWLITAASSDPTGGGACGRCLCLEDGVWLAARRGAVERTQPSNISGVPFDNSTARHLRGRLFGGAGLGSGFQTRVDLDTGNSIMCAPTPAATPRAAGTGWRVCYCGARRTCCSRAASFVSRLATLLVSVMFFAFKLATCPRARRTRRTAV